MSESGKAVIHIINKFKVKSFTQAFRCILIYQDLDTGFCFIRPLLQKIDIEIVMELFKIFTSFGAPRELHTNSCTRETVDNIEAHLKALCPMFEVTYIKKNADDTALAMKVVQKLHEWMEMNNKEEWEMGCIMVQRDINMEGRLGTPTPHKLFTEPNKKVEPTSKATHKNTSVDHTYALADTTKVINIVVESPQTILNFSLDTVNVKEEIIDKNEDSVKEHIIVAFDGGLILPGLKKEPQIEIKLERME